MIFADNSVLWIALALYTAGLLFALWRLALGLPHRRWDKFALVTPAFLLHTLYLWERGVAGGRCPVSNLFETLTFTAWCLVGLYMIITATGRMNYLTAFCMPLVLVIQLAALIISSDQPGFTKWQETSWLGFHASVIMLGYAAFGLAGAVSLMYLFQERQLRTHRIGSSFMVLPPILRLEMAQAWLVLAGFGLLTLGLLSGFAGLKWIRSPVSGGDVKLLWSLGVWGLYLALLLGRYRWRLQGRSMALWSIAGCIFVLTTFWMANAFSQFHQY